MHKPQPSLSLLRISCAWFLFALTLPQVSLAQEDDSPRFELFAQGGISFYTSASRDVGIGLPSPPFPPGSISLLNFRNSFGTAGRLFTGARYYFTPKNALEGSYSYSPNRLQHTLNSSLIPPNPLFPPGTAFLSEPMWAHNVAFNYVRYLPARGRLEPFVTGGLGFVVFAREFDSQTKFAGNLGGGVDIRVNGRLRLRAEFRDFLTERPRFSGFTTFTHNIVPSVGLALRFW